MNKANVIQAALMEVVSFEDVIDYDGQDWIALAGVTFKKDFGPFKTGETVDSLDFRYEDGTLHETDDEGNKCGREANFTMTINPA